jgi:hypothetical protein
VKALGGPNETSGVGDLEKRFGKLEVHADASYR